MQWFLWLSMIIKGIPDHQFMKTRGPYHNSDVTWASWPFKLLAASLFAQKFVDDNK